MAGNLAMLAVADEEEVVDEVRHQWEVQFSRFFNCPAPMASTSPDLVPLPTYLRNRGLAGTWLASSAPAQVSLAVLGPGVVLRVLYGGKLQEEHYVSRLTFSWPQVSCISGFPSRGTRAVFASYRDSVGEIQKFGVRFSTTDETQEFINALKSGYTISPLKTYSRKRCKSHDQEQMDISEDRSDIKPLRSELGIANSLPSHYISPIRPLNSPFNESSVTNPATDFTPNLPISSYFKTENVSFTQQTTPTDVSGFPPSFTSLLTDYCPVVEQVFEYPTVSEEAFFKSKIAKYMEDASFQDMLIKVEKVITEMGEGCTM